MLPEGWSEELLGDHVEIFSGHAPASLEVTSINGVPYVKVDDLNNCARIQREGKIMVRFSGRVVPVNSIIFPKRGAAIMGNKVRITGAELILDTNLMALATKASLDPWFMLYKITWDQLFKVADTSTIPQINNKHITPYRILLPPLPEQRKIAEILSTWDEAIEKTEALHANAEAQKRALVQQLLTGKRRFPEFEGQPWREVRLGEVFVERAERGGSNLPLLAVTSRRGVVYQSETDRRDTSSEDKSNYKQIYPGDIGYNSMRMWQGVSALSSLSGLVSPAYTVVKANASIDASFAAHLFKLPRQVYFFRRFSQGLTSDTWNLKFKQFAEVPARFPILEEQRRIATVLDTADKEIRTAAASVATLQNEKKALMQQLLTGKRRVKA